MVLNSMDFDVIGPDTIVWFGRAVASARTGTLVSGSLAPTVELLRSLAAEPVESGAEPRVVPVATGTGPHTWYDLTRAAKQPGEHGPRR